MTFTINGERVSHVAIDRKLTASFRFLRVFLADYIFSCSHNFV